MKKNNVDVSKGERDKMLVEHFPFFAEFFNTKSSQVDDYYQPFANLLAQPIAQSILQYELNRLAKEDVKYPFSGRQEMPICVFEDVALVMKVLMPGAEETTQGSFLSSLPGDLMIGVAQGGRLGVQNFKESSLKIADQFNPSLSLTSSELKTLSQGDIEVFRSGQDVIRFLNLDEKPIILFILQSQETENILWAYDSETGHPWQSFSFKQRVSRLELAAEYLGSCFNPSAIEPLQLLESDTTHFIRWASVKNQLRRDLGTGTKALNRAIGDQHPHIRKAAEKTLLSLTKTYGGAL